MSQSFITILSAGGAAILGWVLSRKKYRAEVRKVTAEAVQLEINNTEAVINFWKETAADLTVSMKQMRGEMTELKDKMNELIVELETVRTENAELKKKLDQVQQKV